MATKKQKQEERRARAEAARAAQQAAARKERMRAIAVFGAAAVVVIGLILAALVPFLKDRSADKKLADADLASLGVSENAAGCRAPVTKDATGSGQHENPGTPITYPDHPPAFGKHWGNFLYGSEIRTFYSRQDRPELERMVHSLEHGHTIVWYDDSITAGDADYEALEQITSKLGLDSYVMAAPYDKADGGAFPDGAHVAITHWTGPADQKGVWQYCDKVSGSVIKSFVTEHPKESAPEPGAA
nr:DUF3105 domain-containing protein [Marmoricola endophyticus]